MIPAVSGRSGHSRTVATERKVVIMIKYVAYGHHGTIGNHAQAGFQIDECMIALSVKNIDAWWF